MSKRRKPEPPLIDDQPGRLVESPDHGETPAERDVERAHDALQSDDGADDQDHHADDTRSKGDGK